MCNFGLDDRIDLRYITGARGGRWEALYTSTPEIQVGVKPQMGEAWDRIWWEHLHSHKVTCLFNT